jgi:AraC-like DNA-binding protein
MLATYDEVTAQMGDDTVNLDYAKMLRDRAIAAKATGNTAASSSYWQRYSELKDLLNSQLHESKAHEYAARYQLQEERHNTEREEAAKNRIGIIATLLGIILFIVATFVFFLVKQLRSIREKNAVLTKEITDKIKNEEEYLASIKKQADRQSDTTTSIDPSALSDSELFEQLRRIIVEEELYLDPQFGRQQLMDRLHLSKESIGAAFSKGSQYASLASFVNEMRLIRGAKLLVEHPEKSISDVATASGFASNITFSHNFKERYALTPTEFRSRN